MLMKTLIQIVIVAMFGIEICSPFFLGYLNEKEKTKKIYSVREVEKKIKEETVLVEQKVKFEDIDLVDFSGNNYSDSKTMIVKE